MMRKTITVSSGSASLEPVGALVRESLASVGLPSERKELIRQCVEETLGSMIQYSTHKGFRHDISVTADVDASQFRVVFADSLKDFACGGVDDLALDTPFRMGTSMARRVMNEISYTYKKGSRNELELVHAL